MNIDTTAILKELNLFFIHTTSTMSDQSSYLASEIQMLVLDIMNNLTHTQQENLRRLVKTSDYLKTEIVKQRLISRTAIEILQESPEHGLDKIDIYIEVNEVIESIRDFDDLKSLIAVNKPEEKIIIETVTSFLRTGISNLLVWLHLLTPSKHIYIDLYETESQSILKLSVNEFSKENLLESTDKRYIYFSKSCTEFIISVLGGTFNWNRNKLIPENNDVVIHLPKKFKY